VTETDRELAAEVDATVAVAEPGGYAPSVAERLALYQRAGGIVTPLLTAAFAFLAGGIVVVATGHNPWRAYKGIFEGTGLQWFFHVGSYHIDLPLTNHHVFFWWDTSFSDASAYNLQQTLLLTTTLVLTGLAVAFAFRCGLFNIGGQGQYLIGAITGIWLGTRLSGLGHVPHVLLAVVVASLAAAVWAAIAGFLKAATGAHEVITTIMLNWVAYWLGSWVVGQGGPLQDPHSSHPFSAAVVPSAKLAVWWGTADQQGLHIGFFVALAMLVAFWLVLNRTTVGFEVRAVGFNPEAARYGGISVASNYVRAMAISGAFAGLAGVVDILGFQYRLGVADVQASQVGFTGIAVALLGRNKALGVGVASLLFASLFTGTSTRSLDPSVFPPELAGNLTLMIQALVLLFVGADVLVLAIWNSRRKLIRRRPAAQTAAPQPGVGS
jgi:simple sugar transport system permease protein